MKTAATRKLFAYWNARRGSRLAPERGDIEPGAIREILGDSFNDPIAVGELGQIAVEIAGRDEPGQ